MTPHGRHSRWGCGVRFEGEEKRGRAHTLQQSPRPTASAPGLGVAGNRALPARRSPRQQARWERKGADTGRALRHMRTPGWGASRETLTADAGGLINSEPLAGAARQHARGAGGRGDAPADRGRPAVCRRGRLLGCAPPLCGHNGGPPRTAAGRWRRAAPPVAPHRATQARRRGVMGECRRVRDRRTGTAGHATGCGASGFGSRPLEHGADDHSGGCRNKGVAVGAPGGRRGKRGMAPLPPLGRRVPRPTRSSASAIAPHAPCAVCQPPELATSFTLPVPRPVTPEVQQHRRASRSKLHVTTGGSTATPRQGPPVSTHACVSVRGRGRSRQRQPSAGEAASGSGPAALRVRRLHLDQPAPSPAVDSCAHRKARHCNHCRRS